MRAPKSSAKVVSLESFHGAGDAAWAVAAGVSAEDGTTVGDGAKETRGRSLAPWAAGADLPGEGAGEAAGVGVADFGRVRLPHP